MGIKSFACRRFLSYYKDIQFRRQGNQREQIFPHYYLQFLLDKVLLFVLLQELNKILLVIFSLYLIQIINNNHLDKLFNLF